MGGRYFLSVTPSEEDLERARRLPLDACPRRYCWWWRTLTFDWETAVADGCEYLDHPKPSHWENTNTPCCRSEVWTGIDHYESRGLHLTEDGFHPYRFYQELHLRGIEVNDTRLEQLKGLSQLRELHLIGTAVTDDGVKRLQLALPNCKIVR